MVAGGSAWPAPALSDSPANIKCHCFFCYCSATPSVKYGSRTNSGEVVSSFNQTGTDLKQIIHQHVPIPYLSVQHSDQKTALLNVYKYMFQKQTDKAAGEL